MTSTLNFKKHQGSQDLKKKLTSKSKEKSTDLPLKKKQDSKKSMKESTTFKKKNKGYQHYQQQEKKEREKDLEIRENRGNKKTSEIKTKEEREEKKNIVIKKGGERRIIIEVEEGRRGSRKITELKEVKGKGKTKELTARKKEKIIVEPRGRRHRNRKLWKQDSPSSQEIFISSEGAFYDASGHILKEKTLLPKGKKKKEKKPVDFSSSKPQFLLSANHHSHWPPALYHEIAFWGRSNVGKSSLLNELLGCSLAHVSKTPGRTQQLNFYHHPKGLYFVDMPGYGYAQAPLREQGFWERHILSYLEHRSSLKHLYLLLDSRRGIMDLDEQVFSLLKKMQISFSVVFTKKDALPTYAFKELQEKIRDSSFLKNKHVFFVSSKTKEGFDTLKDHIYPSKI